jgi:hypothetical protein
MHLTSLLNTPYSPPQYTLLTSAEDVAVRKGQLNTFLQAVMELRNDIGRNDIGRNGIGRNGIGASGTSAAAAAGGGAGTEEGVQGGAHQGGAQQMGEGAVQLKNILSGFLEGHFFRVQGTA